MQYLAADQSSAPPACRVVVYKVVYNRGYCNLQSPVHSRCRCAVSTPADCYLDIGKQREAQKADEHWQKGEREHSV